eukprot:1796713-Pyramimonas_sp.AAC.1
MPFVSSSCHPVRASHRRGSMHVHARWAPHCWVLVHSFVTLRSPVCQCPHSTTPGVITNGKTTPETQFSHG